MTMSDREIAEHIALGIILVLGAATIIELGLYTLRAMSIVP